MPKWVCFKLKKHVSLVRCCPHPKLVSPDKQQCHFLRPSEAFLEHGGRSLAYVLVASLWKPLGHTTASPRAPFRRFKRAYLSLVQHTVPLSRVLGHDLAGAARRGRQFRFRFRRRTWDRSLMQVDSEAVVRRWLAHAFVPRLSAHSEPQSADPDDRVLGSLRWTGRWWAAARLSGRGGE